MALDEQRAALRLLRSCAAVSHSHCWRQASPYSRTRTNTFDKHMQPCVSWAQCQERCESHAQWAPGQPAQQTMHSAFCKRHAELDLMQKAVVLPGILSCAAAELPPSSSASVLRF